jgi:hypothetical protein
MHVLEGTLPRKCPFWKGFSPQWRNYALFLYTKGGYVRSINLNEIEKEHFFPRSSFLFIEKSFYKGSLNSLKNC